MAETMKTAVFTGIKEIELQECERPVPKGNKALVKIDATAICTWEQRVYTGVNKVEFPFIGGHEIAAHIVELGDEVNRTEWAVEIKCCRATLQCRNCFIVKQETPRAVITLTIVHIWKECLIKEWVD